MAKRLMDWLCDLGAEMSGGYFPKTHKPNCSIGTNYGRGECDCNPEPWKEPKMKDVPAYHFARHQIMPKDFHDTIWVKREDHLARIKELENINRFQKNKLDELKFTDRLNDEIK